MYMVKIGQAQFCFTVEWLQLNNIKNNGLSWPILLRTLLCYCNSFPVLFIKSENKINSQIGDNVFYIKHKQAYMSTFSLNVKTATHFQHCDICNPFQLLRIWSVVLNKPDKILETAAYEITLPTIKTFISGNTIQIQKVQVTPSLGNMDHQKDMVILKDKIKQRATTTV